MVVLGRVLWFFPVIDRAPDMHPLWRCRRFLFLWVHFNCLLFGFCFFLPFPFLYACSFWISVVPPLAVHC